MSERPLECSECKKKIQVVYKELLADPYVCLEMCSDCPVLKSKLQDDSSTLSQDKSSVACGMCGTSLEDVKMGQPLGCHDCYGVFADVIIKELVESHRLPSSLKLKAFGCKTLHVGSSPLSPDAPALSTKLASLNEALNEAIRKENYEQAASLRDQIKHIQGKNESST
jgi:protein arginine kinase activator